MAAPPLVPKLAALTSMKATHLPLVKCMLRCDRHLRLLVGGTYGYVRADDSGRLRTRFHGGIDLFAEFGTPCFAVAPGRVEWVLAASSTAWGNAVLSRHAGGWFSLHAHLSEIFVKPGVRVQGGHRIGLTGISGNGDSAYPHLHFEIWRSLSAGRKGTFEKYRSDPLSVLGPLPFVPFATEVIETKQRLSGLA